MAKTTLSFQAKTETTEGSLTASTAFGNYYAEGTEQTMTASTGWNTISGKQSDAVLIYDSTTGKVELDAGDKIKYTGKGDDSASGDLILLFWDSTNSKTTSVRLNESNDTFEAEDDCEFYLGAGNEVGSTQSFKYKVYTLSSYYTDKTKTISLPQGYSVANDGSNSVALLDADGNEVATVAAGETYSDLSKSHIFYVASDTQNASISYTITTKPAENYSAEYSGGSGMVQIKKKNQDDWVRVFGEAGVDYMLMGEPESDGCDVMFYLSMEGINAARFVCRGEVLDACVNSGSSSGSYSAAIGTDD